jgi:hypothetical protein
MKKEIVLKYTISEDTQAVWTSNDYGVSGSLAIVHADCVWTDSNVTYAQLEEAVWNLRRGGSGLVTGNCVTMTPLSQNKN